MKNLFLYLKYLFYSREDKIERKSISYREAKKVGVLINNPSGDNKGIEQFVSQLQKDGKQVDVICYHGPKHRISYNFSFTPLVQKEITWYGKFKNPRINNFIKTEYDYLYSINNSPFLPFENIIVRSRAKFRIGRFIKNRKPIFDLMIDLKTDEDTVQSLIDKMTAFTKKLETNA